GAAVVGGHVAAVGVRAQRHVPVARVDLVELLPGAGGGAVGVERRGAVLRGDVPVVGVGAQADHGAGRERGRVDDVELLPAADGGAVGDQRRGAGVLRGDVPAVGRGEPADRAVGV